MKQTAKLLALLLILVLPFSLCACGEAAPRVYPIAREIETSTTAYTYSDEEDLGPYVYKAVREYDERGLATRLDVITGSGVLRLDLQYSFDEQGNPVGYTTLVMGLELRAVLENRYEDGALRQAVITELLLEGKPLPPEENGAPAVYRIRTLLPLMLLAPLEHYIGYENCTLRLADSDREIRFENGEQVYSLSEQGSLRTETITQVLPEGGSRATLRYQVTGERVGFPLKEMTREADGEHYLHRVEMLYPDDSRLCISLRYEDGENEDGQKTRLAFFDEITAEGPTAEETAPAIRAEADQPLAEYRLNEKGNVASYTWFTSLLAPFDGRESRQELRYDDLDREISRGVWTSSERSVYSTVTVTEYR